MNKSKIIIGINIVFVALIIMAFLPALKSGDEGYNTKTAAAVPAQQKQEDEGVDNEEVATPEVLATQEDEADVEEQVPAVSMIEDSIDEVVTPIEDVVKGTVSSAESTIAEVKSEVVEAVVPTTEVVGVPAESTIAEVKSEVVEAVVPTTQVAAVPAESLSPVAKGPYSVIEGNKLDAHSYAGFKLFRNWCARCHGTYGQGMVGPDLAESLKFISKEQFYDTVENGKSGTIGSMPAWKANVKVMENRDQLYAYLKARSDGAIGVEKPKKQ